MSKKPICKRCKEEGRVTHSEIAGHFGMGDPEYPIMHGGQPVWRCPQCGSGEIVYPGGDEPERTET